MSITKDKIVLKAYRPWDTSGLENMAEAASSDTNFASTTTTPSSSSQEATSNTNTNIMDQNTSNSFATIPHTLLQYPQNAENNLVIDNTNSSITAHEYNLNAIQKNIEGLMNNKSKEMATIKENIKINDDPKFLIGGFLKPNINIPGNQTKDQKINSLKQDLQKNEYELKILSDHLTTAKALEHASRAEFEKHNEAKMRKLLEEKFNAALHQSITVSEQLKLAIEQLQLFEHDINQEQELRKKTEENLTKFATANETLKDENASLKRRQTEIVSDFDAAKSEFAKIQQKFTELLATKKELFDEVNLNKSTIEKLNNKIESSTKELQTVKERENKLFSENRDLEGRALSLQSEIQNLKSQFAEKSKMAENLEAQIEQNTTLINKLHNIISQEENLRVIAENKTKQVSADLSASENKNQQLNNELSMAENKKNELTTELSMAANKANQLNNELSMAENKTNELTSALSLSENKANQLNTELSEMAILLEKEKQNVVAVKAQAKEAISKAYSALEFLK